MLFKNITVVQKFELNIASSNQSVPQSFSMKVSILIIFLWKLNFLKCDYGTETCFEENVLFTENSLPFDSTIEQCSRSCKSIEECKVSMIFHIFNV